MSHIIIHRTHLLSSAQARQAAEQMATQLADRFDIQYHWRGDSLHFARSGVSGQIDLEPGQLHIHARLGFLLVPLKPRLEQEIHRYLDQTLVTANSQP